jgi:hypothetical protein
LKPRRSFVYTLYIDYC